MKTPKTPYDTMDQSCKRIAIVSLLAAVVAVVLLQQQALFFGFMLSTIAGLALLIVLITMPLNAYLRKRTKGILEDLIENPIAHWKFEGEDWATCNRERYEKRLMWQGITSIVIITLTFVPYVLSMLNNVPPKDIQVSLYTSLALFGIAIFGMGLWLWSIHQWWSNNSLVQGEVYLGDGIVWCAPSTMYIWKHGMGFAELDHIELFEEEPIRLRLCFIAGAGRSQDYKELDLPVPPEQVDAIQQLILQESLYGTRAIQQLALMDDEEKDAALLKMAMVEAITDMDEDEYEELLSDVKELNNAATELAGEINAQELEGSVQ